MEMERICKTPLKMTSGVCRYFLEAIKERLCMNMLAIEYTKSGVELSTAQIDRDACSVYEWLLTKTNENNIILLGRSMGSGPACHVASKYNPKCLVLVSAFESL
jgi:hypothetical protein